MAALAFFSVLGVIVCLVMLVISVIKKNGKVKKWGIGIAICFVLMIVGAINSGSSDKTVTNSVSNTAVSEAKKAADDKAKAEEVQKSANANLYKTLVADLTKKESPMKDTSFNFIKDNSILFPAKTDAAKQKLNEMVDASIQYKHLNKSLTPYLDKVMKVTGTIVKIDEIKQDTYTITHIHLLTDDSDSFETFYLGSVDAFKRDSVTVIGIPVALNQFDNIGGGTTQTAVLVAGDVQKTIQ